MAECIFCRIVAGDIDSREVYRDHRAVAFLDLAPKAPGHTLVVPVEHTDDLTSEPAGLSQIADAVTEVARRLTQQLGASGVNALVNSGAAAGQEVFHLHVHLVPKYAPGVSISSDLDEVAEQLNSARERLTR